MKDLVCAILFGLLLSIAVNQAESVLLTFLIVIGGLVRLVKMFAMHE